MSLPTYILCFEVLNSDDFFSTERLLFDLGAGYPAPHPIYRCQKHQPQNSKHFKYLLCDESGAIALKCSLGGTTLQPKPLRVCDTSLGLLKKEKSLITAYRAKYTKNLRVMALIDNLTLTKAENLSDATLSLIDNLIKQGVSSH